MGNDDSGRTPSVGSSSTVQEFGACELRVRECRDLLQGTTSTYSWSLNGKVLSSVSLVRDGPFLRVSWHNDPRSSKITCPVQLTSTPGHFGGLRRWFYCPSCGRRTGSVFILENSIGCRVCCHLTYQSQRDDRQHRVLTRALRIRNRLGGTGSAFTPGPRPKGMHRRTYDRLVKQLQQLRLESLGCLAVEFRFPGFDDPEEGDLGYYKPRPYRRSQSV